MSRKLALITGGASGIGLGIAKKLASEYDIAIAYGGNHGQAEIAKSEILKISSNVKVSSFSGYLTNYKDCEKLYQNVCEVFDKGPQVLVNSLGRLKDGLFLGSDFSNHIEIINEHVLVTMGLTHLCLKEMYKTKYGRVINLSSISANFAKRGQVNYATAKSAVEGFTRSLALEVAHRGVTVNAIAPGLIETPMTSELIEKMIEAGEKIKTKIPAGHLGTPEDIGSFAAFLCTDEARYITGQIQTIDGGRSLGDSRS